VGRVLEKKVAQSAEFPMSRSYAHIAQSDGKFNTRLVNDDKGVWLSDMGTKIYERYIFW
jgi:hypothetical protein